MARPKNPAAAEQLGAQLRALRVRAGTPSYNQIAFHIHSHIGDERITPSGEWLRLAHTNKVDPWTADLAHLDALARYYGIAASDLHEGIASRLAVIGREWAGPERARIVAMERRKKARRTDATPGRRGVGDGPAACRYAPPKVVTSLFAHVLHPSGDSRLALGQAA